MTLKLNIEYEPKEEDRHQFKWEFTGTPKAQWNLTINGPFSSLPTSTKGFANFAEANGKSLGFAATFSATDHLLTLHLQIVVET